MAENATQESDDILLHFHNLLEEGNLDEARAVLEKLHAAEIAHVLESLPRELREQLWDLLGPEVEGDILLYVPDEVRKNLIGETDNQELIEATQYLDTDDLVDIIPDLPEEVTEEILKSIDEQYRHRLEAVMSFGEDTAGGLMNIDTITVRADISLDVVLRYLRFKGDIPDTTDKLFVVNRDDEFVGTLHLTDLLIKSPDTLVSDLVAHDVEIIPASMSAHDVALLFEKRDLITAPVVDENNKLLGRITIDDVVDVIRDEADHSILSAAGLTEEDDMFAPVVDSSRRRAVWLGLNLLTAILASWVIGHFEATIQQLVALAVLMPIVASMGGIAGSQTLTLVVRGIALGQISGSNAKRLLHKEIAVGSLNGLLWAMVVAVIAVSWFDNYLLGIVIAIAMLANLVIAALAGTLIPLGLKKIGIDPALSAGVLLTTVTDVIGFLLFLGLATMWLI